MKLFGIFRRKKKDPSLEERVKYLENLLDGDDAKPQSSNWSYKDIRKIIDRTDLIPDMQNQELMNIAPSYSRIEKRLDALGKSPDFYTGDKLEDRLGVIEGCISIIHSSHLGHTNFDDAEFQQMHGFAPVKMKGDPLKRMDGMQRKLDLIQAVFEKAEVTMTGKTALQILKQ